MFLTRALLPSAGGKHTPSGPVNVDRLDVRPVRQGAVTLFARDG